MSKKSEALNNAWDETVMHVRGKISDLSCAINRRPATFVGMMEAKAEIMKTLLDAFPMSGTMCPYCRLHTDTSGTYRRVICTDCEYRSVHGECEAGSTSVYRRMVTLRRELFDLVIAYGQSCPEPKDEPKWMVEHRDPIKEYGRLVVSARFAVCESPNGFALAVFPYREVNDMEAARQRAQDYADMLNKAAGK